MNKAACKTQLRARMKHASSRHAKGKALGAYQKCIKGKGRRRRGTRKHRRRSSRSSSDWF